MVEEEEEEGERETAEAGCFDQNAPHLLYTHCS